jgi:hypothetical protein
MNIELVELNKEVESHLVITKSLVCQADDLAEEHEHFHDHYIISGRRALYDLLRKIYVLSEQLNSAVDREDQLALMRSTLLNKHGIRTQENTSDTTVLVRYITRADRKTAHVYSRAIEAARACSIPSVDFSDFLENAGGVERIRANAVMPHGRNQDVSNNAEEMLKLTRKYLEARSELPITSFRLPAKVPVIKSTSSLSYFACYERNGRKYLLAQLPIDPKQEVNLIEGLSNYLCADLPVAKRNIKKFHAKAMAKRKERTIREITKKRPEVGAKMRARMIEVV